MLTIRLQPLSDRIRCARRRANLSQQELALRIGVNSSPAAQWERRGGTKPSMHHLLEIALTTDVQLDWLGTGRGSASAGDWVPAVTADYSFDRVDRELLEVITNLPDYHKLAILKFIKNFF